MSYEIFTVVLTSYGLPVMNALLRRGQIFQLTAARGRPVNCPDSAREHLAGFAGRDDRHELSLETVAAALKSFHKRTLVPGNWTPEGGASLNTYFVGACVLEFANIFRAWLAKEFMPRRDLLGTDTPLTEFLADKPLDITAHRDPADIAVDIMQFDEALNAAKDPKLRKALATLVLTGEGYTAIAEQVGMSTDALKMAISRFRKKMRALQEGS
ncbi:hypothetical protein ACTG9Q_13520 [Actinokineospora sp. 24-640]